MATFNSRYLTCRQISDMFVPTQNFYKLAKPCHSILLGARGSGKTTMLKMLQPEAVRVFNSQDDKLDIPFYGVYIPSDRQWSLILEQLDEQANPFFKHVSQALVNLNVMLAFLETLNSVLKDKDISSSDNYNFCKTFIQQMRLDENLPPVIEIINLHLRNLVIELQNAVREGNYDYVFPLVCKTNFMDSLTLVLGIIDWCYSKYNLNQLWALCFDEMEIAPEWLQNDIVGHYLRSKNQRLFFKITSTPDWTIPLNSFRDPSVGNDIEVIKCWNSELANFAEWKSFCNVIIDNMLFSKYGIDRDALRGLITVEKQDRTFYLENLPKVDKGFADYFLRDSDRDDNNKPVISRSSIRSKFYNGLVLAMRYQHFCYVAKKNYSHNFVYLGDWLLYSMADGNPRSLLHILDEIPVAMEVDGRLRMNIPVLNRVVREYSAKAMEERFSYCVMKPIELASIKYSFRDILMAIGDYFRNDLLGEKYNPFPRTMFAVDGSSELLRFIHVGLESGALIRIDDRNAYSGKYLNGVYRLTFMLYPYFGYVHTPTKDVVLLEDILKEKENETK